MTAVRVLAIAALLAGAAGPAWAARPQPVPHDAQTVVVETYLRALQNARYAQAFAVLNTDARAYYRDVENFRSVYVADSYRISGYELVGARGDAVRGRVFFARETASFRDFAHDTDLRVTATVPVGVVLEHGTWRIKDPGHPWRAFAANSSGQANGVRVVVKKLSFFERRIEAVVTVVNGGDRFVTVLAYGKSLLHDSGGRPFRPIETRDWSLTDKVLFEGLRLAPDAQYTGTLSFACQPLDDTPRRFVLTLAPLLADGADAPFAIDVAAIAPAPK